MFKFVSGVCAAAMMIALPLTTPGFAMPRTAPAAQAEQAGVILVQRNHDRRGERNWRGGDHRGQYRNHQRPSQRPSQNWSQRDDGFYLRGHRGYRHHRPGYRQYNGWWFPPAAFIAGAIVGGAMTAEPPIQYRPRGDAHISWCYSRYRSYRSSDNTFQPYNGPRRACVSPYG